MNRRTAWLICITLTLVPATIHADEIGFRSSSVVIGGHLGIDFATVGGTELNDTNLDFSYRAGFTAGASVLARLARILSVRAELGFAVKGDRVKGLAPSTSSTSYLGYLEIPILLQASVPISEKIEPYGYVGPALGILLDADVETDDGRHIEINDRIESLDVGLMFGAGVAVDVGAQGALTFDVRYNLGLRDRITRELDETSLNRVIYFTIGYQTDLSIFSGRR